MLKLLGAKQLSSRDAAHVLRVLDADPVAACMVAARVEEGGIDPRMIHGELWSRGGPLESLCFSGANFVPLRGSIDDMRAFADRACRTPAHVFVAGRPGRTDTAAVEMLEMDWGACPRGPARPAAAGAGEYSAVPPGPPLVRQVRMHELEQYLPAAVAMFIEEVGIDPRANDGGRGYRRRVANLIAAGRAWARFDDGQVVFKAEVGSVSSRVGQIQGVWVHPMYRGHGFGAAGTATVAEAVIAEGRIASLYVNSFNTVARSAYARIGFSQVATFATILLD